MGVPELRARLTKWLSSDSRAVLFEQAGELVAYALCRDSDPCAEGKDAIYLRQFLVVASKRRQGIGRRAFELLMKDIWAKGRKIFLEALSSNLTGQAFWRSLGFEEHSIQFAYRN